MEGPETHDQQPWSSNRSPAKKPTISNSEEDVESQSALSYEKKITDPDTGKAWLIVLAGCINEGLSWGFAISYGIFQDYYTHSDGAFKDDGRLAMVGVLATGVLYLGVPIMNPIATRYLAWRRTFVIAGLIIQIVSLVAASFARNTPTLIVTQGLFFAFGFVVLYMPIISLTNEWFEKRRGLAYGFIYASTGITGMPMPFLLQWLLDKYGAPTTLRVCAIGLLLLAGPTIFLVRPRIPREGSPNANFFKSYGILFRRSSFWLYCISCIFQGLGAYYPALFLPEYATNLGMKASIGAATIVLYCFGQAIGQIAIGALSDRFTSPEGLVLLSSIPPGVATFFLWGFGQTAAPILVYALLFGLCAPAYTVLFARMGTTLSKDPNTILASYGMFLALKGLGTVLEGPLSGVLKHGPVEKGQYAAGAYDRMILFTGVSMLLSALAVTPLLKWGWLRGKIRRSNHTEG